MKHTIIIAVPATAIIISFAPFTSASAALLNVKLPYPKGQSFVVVQGYNTLPTHIKKDAYALDLSQDGCQAYGKPVAAAAAGTAMVVEEEGYNGGYGTEVIMNHGNNIVSRYAHMIPGSIKVGLNMPIEQGQIIGSVGDTGLVAGLACPEHPGTHLHFAMDVRNDDGTLIAHDPEPISGYRNIIAGKWYASDNGSGNNVPGEVLGAATTTIIAIATSSSSSIVPAVTSSVAESAPVVASSVVVSSPPAGPNIIVFPPVSPVVPIGGVAIVPSAPTNVSMPASPTMAPTSTIIAAPTSTTTSTIVSVSSTSVLFKQPDDSVSSPFSWYGDNWFDLGAGFSGTLNALTLKAAVSNSVFFASHVELQEFKDPNYTAMIKQFTISDNAPFTSVVATATFTGLSITLKPYFYYRLVSTQDYQNRSIIFAGTSSTGTQMWNNFVYGVGRVESTSTFMPFIEMDGIAATSTLPPASLTPPKNILPTFDELGMKLNVSFRTSTDPEWPDDPLYYEINFSTSSVFDAAAWGSAAETAVIPGSSYLIGVRALNDFGDVSAVATTTWSVPPGFTPYTLSTWADYATQDFILPADGTLSSIEIFTTNFSTGSRNPDTNSCVLFLSYSPPSPFIPPAPPIQSDNRYSGSACAGDLTFSFASSSPALSAGHDYQWIFQLYDGGPSARGGVQFYGTASNTAQGTFSDPAIVNAKFKIFGQSGASDPLFAN